MKKINSTFRATLAGPAKPVGGRVSQARQLCRWYMDMVLEDEIYL